VFGRERPGTLLLMGANMGGKSTLLRATGVLAIMAQVLGAHTNPYDLAADVGVSAVTPSYASHWPTTGIAPCPCVIAAGHKPLGS